MGPLSEIASQIGMYIIYGFFGCGVLFFIGLFYALEIDSLINAVKERNVFELLLFGGFLVAISVLIVAVAIMALGL